MKIPKLVSFHWRFQSSNVNFALASPLGNLEDKYDKSPIPVLCNFAENSCTMYGVGTVPYLFVGESCQAEDVDEDSDDDLCTKPYRRRTWFYPWQNFS